MIGILATCLLGFSPGVQLADTAAHRHVYLDTGKIRLVDYASEVGLNQLNREDLLNELNRLEKPSFVTPIVLLSLGGGLGIVGAIVATSSRGVTLMVVGLVGAGVVLVVVGAVILAVRFVQSGAYAEKLAAIQRRLDAVDQSPGEAPKLPPAPPPPPPPPSTGAQAWAPAPQFLLAVF